MTRNRPLFSLLLAGSLAAASVAAAEPPAPCGLELANPGFEATGPRVPGWLTSQHTGDLAYEMVVVDDIAAAGRKSFRVTRLREQVYGQVGQKIAARSLAGKTLVLSARVRTDNVGPRGATLVVNAEGSEKPHWPVGILAAYKSEAVHGTGDWRTLRVEAPVPPGTRTLMIGFSLLDSGTAWLDEVCLGVSG